jgi:hypothetical protein
MNIYDIFRKHSPRGNLSVSKLQKIHEEICPGMPWALMVEHRRIYHLQRSLSFWKPVVRNAPEADTGGFIDHRGVIRATNTSTPKQAWYESSPYATHNEKRALKIKQLKDADRKNIAIFMNDRNVNVIYINEHTVPKWEPRSKTICLDKANETTELISRLLGYNHLVLRAEPLPTENQYDLWTISKRTKTLKRQVATIQGNTIGLGKSKHGSKRSGQIKVTKAVTEQLDV